MSIVILLISFVITNFVVFPFIDSFAYVKKNVLLHILIGILIAFIHTMVGLNGIVENIIFLLVVFYSRKYGYEDIHKKNPEMTDVFGHMVVKNANTVFAATFAITYLILNVTIGKA